jgi:transcriptional regulator with XRE-family HTH domain
MELKVEDYYEMDEEATRSNIANLIEGCEFSHKAIANIMHTESRNVDNWVRGSSMPTLADVVALSGILGISMDQLIIKKYQTKGIELGEAKTKRQIEDLFNQHCAKHDESETEGIIEDVLVRAYCASQCPIQSLNDFLIILPIISKDIMDDLLSRITCMGAGEEDYIRNLMYKIWSSLPKEEKGKRRMQLFKSRYPWLAWTLSDEAWNSRKHVACNQTIEKALKMYINDYKLSGSEN